MLKASFPVNVISDHAAYEIAYGTITRPTHNNTSWDKAKFEVSAHKWADLSDNGYGVSLLNDCKYGYDIKSNLLRISLLRSTLSPDHRADQGEHEFTYSLYPHKNNWAKGDVVKNGYNLNVPAKAVYVSGKNDGVLPTEYSFINLCPSCENVIIDTLKAAEDSNDLILRVYESCGVYTNAKIDLHLKINQVIETNLMEIDEKEMPMSNNNSSNSNNNNSFSFNIRPFEIKTFRLKKEAR